MRRLPPLLLALLLAGCASTVYKAATDERSLGDQAADARICTSIRSSLTAKDSGALTVMDVFCHDQLVVLTGALPPNYALAKEAVGIAKATSGVRRVETYYVPKPAQDTGDTGISVKLKAKLVGDTSMTTAGTDFAVVGGNVVLVGVVDDKAKADKIVAHARSIEGVKSVKSFIQVKPPAKGSQ